MKRMKKLLAIVLVGVMTLAMGSMAFGAEATGTSTDTGTITVSGLESGVTVSAYKIAEATYDETTGQFTGYKMIVSGSLINEDGSLVDGALTESNLAALFAQTGTATTTAVANADGVATLAGLAVGSYLLVVSGSESATYALMIGSVSYSTDESTGEMSIADGEIDVEGSNTWAKKTEPGIDKEDYSDGTESKGESHNVGDEVTYHIHVGPIPTYYGEYPTFEVIDEMTGLTITDTEIANIKISVVDSDSVTTTGSTVLTADTDYTVTTINHTDFDINFVVSGSYTLNDYAGKYLLIEYQATITSEAEVDGSADHSNDAKLEYSTTSYTNAEPVDVETGGTSHEYTFSVTSKKVGSDTGSDGLEGATFALYTDEACATPYTQNSTALTATSDSSGNFTFGGLAEGTYYLKETDAPEGYALSNAVYTVTIEAAYDEDGVLTSVTTTLTNNGQSITQIVNTKVAGELPSTGGRGTLIFTLIGCAIVVCAVAGVVATRKRRAA